MTTARATPGGGGYASPGGGWVPRLHPPLRIDDDRAERDPEGFGEAPEGVDRRVADTAFDAAHVGSVEAGRVAERLLGQVGSLPGGDKRDAECSEKGVDPGAARLGHAPNLDLVAYSSMAYKSQSPAGTPGAHRVEMAMTRLWTVAVAAVCGLSVGCGGGGGSSSGGGGDSPVAIPSTPDLDGYLISYSDDHVVVNDPDLPEPIRVGDSAANERYVGVVTFSLAAIPAGRRVVSADMSFSRLFPLVSVPPDNTLSYSRISIGDALDPSDGDLFSVKIQIGTLANPAPTVPLLIEVQEALALDEENLTLRLLSGTAGVGNSVAEYREFGDFRLVVTFE